MEILKLLFSIAMFNEHEKDMLKKYFSENDIDFFLGKDQYIKRNENNQQLEIHIMDKSYIGYGDTAYHKIILKIIFRKENYSNFDDEKNYALLKIVAEKAENGKISINFETLTEQNKKELLNLLNKN